MTKICLYGAPGAGKTTIGQALQQRLNVELIEGDYLRPLAQKLTSREDDPFLYVGTLSAWQEFGGPTQENITRGLLAVRLSMTRYVERDLNRSTPYIFEAAFVDPSVAKDLSKLFLIITVDESLHRAQYFTHRELTDEAEIKFWVAREIQNYLVSEATAMGTVIIHNNGDVEQTVDTLVSQI